MPLSLGDAIKDHPKLSGATFNSVIVFGFLVGPRPSGLFLHHGITLSVKGLRRRNVAVTCELESSTKCVQFPLVAELGATNGRGLLIGAPYVCLIKRDNKILNKIYCERKTNK